MNLLSASLNIPCKLLEVLPACLDGFLMLHYGPLLTFLPSCPTAWTHLSHHCMAFRTPGKGCQVPLLLYHFCSLPLVPNPSDTFLADARWGGRTTSSEVMSNPHRVPALQHCSRWNYLCTLGFYSPYFNSPGTKECESLATLPCGWHGPVFKDKHSTTAV